MKQWIERLLARSWNWSRSRRRPERARGVDLGAACSESGAAGRRVAIPHARRAEHVAILGKTGSGKSFLIRHMIRQDVAWGRGFCCFDIHGDLTPFVLGTIAEEERREGTDLSDQTIVIEPSDPEYSVGLNPLEAPPGVNRFVQIAEITQLLKERWQLDSFGARTDELLRNTLYVLAENRLTLLEAGLLLADAAFRKRSMKNVGNAEVKQYFELRYDQASEPMRAVMREPLLNKISTFTADPQFRTMIGQARSTFSVGDALDQGQWIVLNLDRGRLGEQAATLGGIFLARIKHALFARKRRELYTLYLDEVQNLVAYAGVGLETMLAQARKMAVGIVTANQFLDQYPPEMRAAIMAVGAHVLFRLSPQDAQQMASALDGGKSLAELLKNLPRRHMVVKSASERWHEVQVPHVVEPKAPWADLYERCRRRWARPRAEGEDEIRRRHAEAVRTVAEALNEWE